MKFGLKSNTALSILVSSLLTAYSGGQSSEPNPSWTPSPPLPDWTPPPPLSDDEFQSWTPERIPHVKISELRRASSDQIRSLTRAQVQALTPAQIAGLLLDHIQALASQGSTASLRDFSPAQIAALGSNINGLHNLTPLEQLQAFTVEQFEAMPEANRNSLPQLIRDYYGHRIDDYRFGEGASNRRWTPEQVQGIDPAGFNQVAFSVVNMRELFLHISDFSVAQIAAIHPVYMRLLWSLPLLSDQQIQALTIHQIGTLSGKQLNLLSADQIRALSHLQRHWISLNGHQVRELSPAFIEGIFPEILPDQIRLITGDQITNIVGIVGINNIANLIMKWVIVHCNLLNRDQLQSIPVAKMNLFGSEDLFSMDVQQVPNFSPEQISAIDADVISGFRPRHIPHLTTEQVRALTPEQINALRIHNDHMAAFTREQIQAFTADQISGVEHDRVYTFFTPRLISHLTQDQALAITLQQLRALRIHDTQRRALLALPQGYLSRAQRQQLQ